MSTRQIQIALLVLLLATLGMGAYAYRLLRQQRSPKVVEARPVGPPVTGNSRGVVLMLAADPGAALRKVERQTPLPSDPARRIQELVRLLLAAYAEPDAEHRLAPDSDVNEVFIVDGGGVVLNMNAAFAAKHPAGVLEEQLTVESILATVAANVPSVSRVKFLIEGKEQESLAGHIELGEFFPVK